MAFDLLAVALAVLGGWLAYRWCFQAALEDTASRINNGYFIALSAGSVVGAYLFGTLNLYLSGIPEAGRSIVGALFGATMMVELYKARKDVKGSTGYIYVIPFSICVIVGRLGCFFSGLKDNTYGLPTSLPWGVDFGDHIMRHPVQLYESLSMLVFLVAIIVALKCCRGIIIRYGYYLCVGFYALQRFLWEFLKPYAHILGPLNLFQYVCVALIIYSLVMVLKVRNASRTT